MSKLEKIAKIRPKRHRVSDAALKRLLLEEFQQDDDNFEHETSDMSAIGPEPQPQPMDQGIVTRAAGTSNNATQGYRGPLVGNGMNNADFAKTYREQLTVHSRWTKFQDMLWDYIDDDGEGPRNQNYAWSNSGIDNYDPGAWNAPFGVQSPQMDRNNKSISMEIFSKPINFFIQDFVDTKLLHQWTALYDKFRLINFKITVDFETWNIGSHIIRPMKWAGVNIDDGGAVANEVYVSNNNWNFIPQGLGGSKIGSQAIGGTDRPLQRVPISYYVYRDAYHDFVYTSADADWKKFTIPYLPNQGANAEARKCYQIANMNNYLTKLSPGESYHFEKDIAAKANYFIPASWLNQEANLKRNIAVLVNALEGITNADADYAQPLFEGYNILIAPINMPFVTHLYNWNAEEGGKAYFEPLCTTKVYIKCESTWEAWDFKYYNDQPAGRTIGSEPLAQFAEKAHQFKLTNIKQFHPRMPDPRQDPISNLSNDFLQRVENV